jgi:hypothetical protein
MSDFTADDLIAISRAIASGELTVEYHDRRVTYRSIAELKQAKAIIEAALGTSTRPRTSLVYRVKD